MEWADCILCLVTPALPAMRLPAVSLSSLLLRLNRSQQLNEMAFWLPSPGQNSLCFTKNKLKPTHLKTSQMLPEDALFSVLKNSMRIGGQCKDTILSTQMQCYSWRKAEVLFHKGDERFANKSSASCAAAPAVAYLSKSAWDSRMKMFAQLEWLYF